MTGSIEEEPGKMALSNMERQIELNARTLDIHVYRLLFARAWPLRRTQCLGMCCSLDWWTKTFVCCRWHDDGEKVSWWGIIRCPTLFLSFRIKPRFPAGHHYTSSCKDYCWVFARIWSTNSTMARSLTRPFTNRAREGSPREAYHVPPVSLNVFRLQLIDEWNQIGQINEYCYSMPRLAVSVRHSGIWWCL